MEGVLALMIPLTVLMIPITAIITGHIRRMAELKYSRPSGDPDEVAALRREVAELKEMVHTQMLALDVYSKARPAPRIDENLQDRISR